MTKQTITALFDTRAAADTAALALRQSGIPADDVTVSPENARDELNTGFDTATTKRTGFWASIEDMFGGYDDHATYTEGVRRGGVLLTAHVEDAQLDRTVAMLEQYGAVDLEEREQTWHGEGWAGSGAMASTGIAGAGATTLAMTGTMPAATASATAAQSVATAVPMAVASPTEAVRAGQDDVLQVVEERLSVGKRAVSRGKVRLHSYVVEKQVSEDVTLRDETVSIDRRVVDRPVAALGADVFKDRTIDMEEIDEEAVVSKTARVVEEIGIRKDAVERTETIRDTVRSTKVDIEDGRVGTVAGSGAVASFASKLVKDMEVVGSDGMHVGRVDHVDGEMVKLKRMDPNSGGQHHLISATLVKSVAGKAVLSITAKEAMARWTAA